MAALAADLLEEINRDDLYDAVLDRDDTEVSRAKLGAQHGLAVAGEHDAEIGTVNK